MLPSRGQPFPLGATPTDGGTNVAVSSEVADAVPVDGTRTRIDVYAPTIGSDPLNRAITGWATGENVGCPDMTKN